MKTLKDKVAVVTGGGNGIGRALALELARKGCHLALVDVSEDGLDETREELLALNAHIEVSTHIADVSDRAAMQTLADDVVTAHGKVNILINNAGITFAKSFEGHSLEDWERIIGINIWGAIYGCHFFLPYLREQAGDAHIVNMSSMVAFLAPPEQTSYAATKSAIKGLSESLWAELHGEGIGVTVVHPGAIRTSIMDKAMETAEDRDAFAKTKAMVDKMAMPAERAAKKIVRAIRKDEMRLVIGADARLFESAKRAMPKQIHKLFLLAG